MSQRVSLYAEVHKGIRSELFHLALATGQQDPADRQGVERLIERFETVGSLLEEHAQHEEGFVEPLLKLQSPELATAIAREHENLEARVSDLRSAMNRWLRSNDGEQGEAALQAYVELTDFIGVYLGHMAREEATVMPVLQAAMSDQELLRVSAELRASIPPPRMAEFMSFMLPAMNVQERTQVFLGLKEHAPVEALAAMSALAREVLSPADWSEVKARAGV